MVNATEPKLSVLEEIRNELMKEIRQAVPETAQYTELKRKIRALTAQINRLEEATPASKPKEAPQKAQEPSKDAGEAHRLPGAGKVVSPQVEQFRSRYAKKQAPKT